MIKIGITGKIGTGKTTVSKILKLIGYKVFESDKEVRKAFLNLEIKEKIKKQFARNIPNLFFRNGFLNRKSLGKYVFSNKNELVILENIVHPIINQAQKLFIKNNKNDAVLFFDIPLLFEKKKYKNFDYIFYTFVEESVQKKRVLKRKEMTANKFEKILKNQKHDLSKFRKYISLEINTIESKEEVKKKICIFLEKLNF